MGAGWHIAACRFPRLTRLARQRKSVSIQGKGSRELGVVIEDKVEEQEGRRTLRAAPRRRINRDTETRPLSPSNLRAAPPATLQLLFLPTKPLSFTHFFSFVLYFFIPIHLLIFLNSSKNYFSISRTLYRNI